MAFRRTHIAQDQIGGRVSGIERKGALYGLLGFVEPALGFEYVRQCYMDIGALGARVQDLPVAGLGFVQPAGLLEDRRKRKLRAYVTRR